MKRLSLLLGVLILLTAICSCATELPATDPLASESDTESYDQKTPSVIDRSIYTPEDSEILYKGYNDFANLPGMVLVMDQSIHYGGMHLSYINKADQKAYYFCADPLCNHDECDTGYAGMFVWPSYYVWSSVDQNLYTLRGKDGYSYASDGALYLMDINTREVDVVVPTNGNKIYSIYATDNYILLERAGSETGKEIIRYDPLTKKSPSVVPPQGRIFRSLYVSGEIVLVAFMDDPYYYLTTPKFEEYQPTAMKNFDFLLGTTAYGVADIDGNTVDVQPPLRVLYKQDLLTGDVTTLYTHEDSTIICVGFDGEYIYYVLSDPKPNEQGRTNLHGTVLYRIAVSGGEPEPMFDFCAENTGLRSDFYAAQVRSYDGVLYAILSQVISTGHLDVYGMITCDDGQWRFDTLTAGD